jgi:hypothetical protein
MFKCCPHGLVLGVPAPAFGLGELRHEPAGVDEPYDGLALCVEPEASPIRGLGLYALPH